MLQSRQGVHRSGATAIFLLVVVILLSGKSISFDFAEREAIERFVQTLSLEEQRAEIEQTVTQFKWVFSIQLLHALARPYQKIPAILQSMPSLAPGLAPKAKAKTKAKPRPPRQQRAAIESTRQAGGGPRLRSPGRRSPCTRRRSIAAVGDADTAATLRPEAASDEDATSQGHQLRGTTRSWDEAAEQWGEVPSLQSQQSQPSQPSAQLPRPMPKQPAAPPLSPILKAHRRQQAEGSGIV